MKILWFEITEPSGYRNEGTVIGGWQDSLERIVRYTEDIELHVAFNGGSQKEKKCVSGVTYHPVTCQLSILDKLRGFYTCNALSEKLVKGALKVINEVKPDIIHVFGLEWPWGLVAEYVDIPVVIHIMGSMVPYYNALYPPKYNENNIDSVIKSNPLKWLYYRISRNVEKTRLEQEKRIWRCVKYYMGRTDWDYALSRVMAPSSQYWHVDEALRSSFLDNSIEWRPVEGKLYLFSTGCGTFWKGPDMLLKTARILKDLNINFEWKVAGKMQPVVKKTVEKTEGYTFESCNVKILGFTKQEELREMLLESSIYVHTAYIENSPNSICEAQCLGIPVVSTNVGGISTLVNSGETGILVPANDPWQMAYNILSLWDNKDMKIKLSTNAKKVACQRHSPNEIRKQLLHCYNNLIKYSNK